MSDALDLLFWTSGRSELSEHRFKIIYFIDLMIICRVASPEGSALRPTHFSPTKSLAGSRMMDKLGLSPITPILIIGDYHVPA